MKRVPELGADLLREWQATMQAVATSLTSGARQSDIAQRVLEPMQRQAEVLGQLLERERALQGDLVARAFKPFDAVFDLLEQSATTLRRQAQAMEEASRAIEQVAGMMKEQADIFAGTLHVIREPAEAVKSLAGVERSPASRPGSGRRARPQR